jgi:hypothetical protein
LELVKNLTRATSIVPSDDSSTSPETPEIDVTSGNTLHAPPALVVTPTVAPFVLRPATSAILSLMTAAVFQG